MSGPGHRIRALCARWCSADTMARLVDPIVADLQAEHADAARRGAWRARGVLTLGYVGFWAALAIYGAQHSGRAIATASGGDWWRTIRAPLAAIAALTLVGAGAPWVAIVRNPSAVRAPLLVWLLPQALTISLPIGLAIGLVVNARPRASARRSTVLVFAVAAGVTLASFVNVAWILPMGNQAFRVGAAGHQVGRGVNELTLGELASLLEPGAHEPMLHTPPARRLNIATAYHARWALTWAGLVLAVFVVGIGRWARRRIVLVLAGVAVSLGYYALVFVGFTLAWQGVWPPAAGTWLANGVFALGSIALLVTGSVSRPTTNDQRLTTNDQRPTTNDERPTTNDERPTTNDQRLECLVPSFAMIAAVSVSHLLNDTIQAILPAIYPLLKTAFALTFAQVGLMTFTQQLTASLLQPLVGYYTDRRPTPYSLVIGMSFTLVGVLLLAVARTFPALLGAAGLMGVGSSVFHPEASRVARMASGGRHGLAQSLFQVGGNVGSSLGPLVGAFVIAPRGQSSIAWSAILAVAGLIVMWRIGVWYAAHDTPAHRSVPGAAGARGLLDRQVARPMAILAALIFSKYLYLAGLNSYYTFFLISKFHVGVQTAQVDLFVFMAAVAAGTIVGGAIGDRIGVRYVIWGSILGVLPFTLLLPYANLFWTPILTVVIGLVLASAFSAIVVYAQELVPGRVGLVSGLFFGLAFGIAGLGAAVLGRFADRVGIEAVYRVCAFLPAIGLLAVFLPDLDRETARAAETPDSRLGLPTPDY